MYSVYVICVEGGMEEYIRVIITYVCIWVAPLFIYRRRHQDLVQNRCNLSFPWVFVCEYTAEWVDRFG